MLMKITDTLYLDPSEIKAIRIEENHPIDYGLMLTYNDDRRRKKRDETPITWVAYLTVIDRQHTMPSGLPMSGLVVVPLKTKEEAVAIAEKIVEAQNPYKIEAVTRPVASALDNYITSVMPEAISKPLMDLYTDARSIDDDKPVDFGPGDGKGGMAPTKPNHSSLEKLGHKMAEDLENKVLGKVQMSHPCPSTRIIDGGGSYQCIHSEGHPGLHADIYGKRWSTDKVDEVAPAKMRAEPACRKTRHEQTSGVFGYGCVLMEGHEGKHKDCYGKEFVEGDDRSQKEISDTIHQKR